MNNILRKLALSVWLISVNSCSGSDKEIKFKDLKNTSIISQQDLSCFIQYGVDANGIVCYVVITNDISPSVLTIYDSIHENGKKEDIAKIEVDDRELPPPDVEKSLVYFDTNGLERSILKKINEDDFKKLIKDIKIINAASIREHLSVK